MSHGREGMMLDLTDGECASAGEAERRRGPTEDGQSGPSRLGKAAPCDALRLLATLVEGARAPVIAGDVATVTTWVPLRVLDDLPGVVAGIADPDATAAGPPDASGAWSGVLLPMLREAGRLLPDILDGIGAIEPYPEGGCDVTVTLALALHDRLALWGANLDLVAHLIEPIEARPPLLLTALDPCVPQDMAAVVLDLYAAEVRPPEAPGQASAA